jgi:hypothetical protein
MFGGTISPLPDDVGGEGSHGNAKSEAAVSTVVGTPDAMQSGAGSAQWGDGPPTYTLRVGLENIQPDLVAAMWREKWGRGTASVEIRLKTQGWSMADLAQNASGNFAIDWRGGTLAASFPSGESVTATAESADAASVAQGITHFQRLRAVGHFRDQKLTLEFGQIALAGRTVHRQANVTGIQSLSGTVTFSRMLDLRMQPSGVSITGPLDLPVMKPRTAKLLGSGKLAHSENP